RAHGRGLSPSGVTLHPGRKWLNRNEGSGSAAGPLAVGQVEIGQAPDPLDCDPGMPLPKPESVLVTLKSLLTFTVTIEPSGLRTCASYGEPSESVSTRMIVPPGTAARAAALTLVAVPSVRSVSPGPCDMVAGSTFPLAAAAVDDWPALEFALCAPASGVPARTAPPRTPLATRPA